MQFLIDIGLALLYFCAFLLLCAWSWKFWMMYVNQKFLANLKWILLEIKLPREITKSPLATEVALTAFLQSAGVGTKYHKYFKGQLPTYGSLEIASIEGVVHFYIRVQSRFRTLIESNFYAQYPGIEIVEADDYTKLIRFHHLAMDTHRFWGTNFALSRKWEPVNEKTGKKYGTEKEPLKMRADFFPIKTYVDFGLDKDPKEEHKTDPVAQIVEIMGNIGKGEHFWYQLIVNDESVYNGKNKMPKFYVNKETHDHMSLSEMASKYKKQIRTSGYNIKGDTPVNDFGIKEQVNGPPDAEGKPTKVDAKFAETKAIEKREIELSPEDKDEIEAINKKLSKPLVVVVMRAAYVCKVEYFNNGAHTADVLSLGRPFAGANSFLLDKITDPYDYPWQNIGFRRVPWRGEESFEAYVEREGLYPHIPERKALDKWEDAFFWSSTMKNRKLFRMIYEAIFHPFDHPTADLAFTLNLEELATLWHLPGAVAGSPGLPRIDSAKGVAPVNLPL